MSTSTVNPIVVIRDNLPDYVLELIVERQRIEERLVTIDQQIAVAHRLADVIGIEVANSWAVRRNHDEDDERRESMAESARDSEYNET